MRAAAAAAAPTQEQAAVAAAAAAAARCRRESRFAENKIQGCAPLENVMEDADWDEGTDIEDEEEWEMTISCCQRHRRWEVSEEARRELLEAEASSLAKAGQSHEQASTPKQKTFDPHKAFMLLSKELLHTLRHQSQSCDVYVDSVGDDVYTWSVELAVSAFDPSSNLYKDMQDIQRRHKYSFIKLLLHFKRGLHPFHPPSVEVIRPHLIATCSPRLQLGLSWAPWQRVEELISQIKLLLQAAARVDLEHPMNDISRYPESAYRPEEQQLAWLDVCLDSPSGLELLELACQVQNELEQDSQELPVAVPDLQEPVPAALSSRVRIMTRFVRLQMFATYWRQRLAGTPNPPTPPYLSPVWRMCSSDDWGSRARNGRDNVSCLSWW